MLHALLSIGCTAWNTTDSQSSGRLPVAQLSQQSIGVEIATVTLEPNQSHLLDEIVAHLDEQVVSADIRERLARNGIRVGIFGAQLPAAASLLLIEAADRRRHPTAETQAYADEQRFVQCRETKSVPAKIWGERELDVTYDNGDFTSSERLSQAESLVRVSGKPARGGASIRLLPEIAYGTVRQKFVVQDNAFHMEAKRDRSSYDDLAIELDLRPGECLMLTSNSWPERSLGQAFFENNGRQKILLIRLAQTPVDEFFRSESVAAN